MGKKEKTNHSLNKEQKEELTHQAFWQFAAALTNNTDVDLLKFQKKIKLAAFPNRTTPNSKEEVKIQNTQDQQIIRIVRNSLPKMYPLVEIVTKSKKNSPEPKFRPYLRMKTANHLQSIKRKWSKEFLNSDLFEMVGISNKLLAKNIKENRHLIEKYNLKDKRDLDGISEKFSDKNIQKWKEGRTFPPEPLLLLIYCTIHKFGEIDNSWNPKGRPRKIKGLTDTEYQNMVNQTKEINEMIDLGEYAPFNSLVILMLHNQYAQWHESIIKILTKEWLSYEETTEAIWNIYSKDISYNPIKNIENYFTKKDLLEEVVKIHATMDAQKKIDEFMNTLGLADKNKVEEVKSKNAKELASNMNSEKNNKYTQAIEIQFGELGQTTLEIINIKLKAYINIYKEFRLAGLTSSQKARYDRSIKKENSNVESASSQTGYRDDWDEHAGTVTDKKVIEEKNDPEDYFGI